jgi:hypothetical protein
MKLNQVSIIIKGSWNPKIFTPSWIIENLILGEAEGEVEVLVMFEQLEFGFRHNDIGIFPKTDSIEIQSLALEGNSLSSEVGTLMETIMVRIFKLLPHTPVKAFGINFKFEAEKHESLKFIDFIQTIPKQFNDFKTSQHTVTKVYNDYTLNLVCDLSNEIISLQSNFHYSSMVELKSNTINSHFNDIQNIIKNGTEHVNI